MSFDTDLAQRILAGLSQLQKRSFVPMPGGQAEPVAGASQMTAGMTQPMGGAPGQPPAVDPATGQPMPAGPAPADPAMMGMTGGGGMPVDEEGNPVDPATGQPLPPPEEMPAPEPAPEPAGMAAVPPDEFMTAVQTVVKETMAAEFAQFEAKLAELSNDINAVAETVKSEIALFRAEMRGLEGSRDKGKPDAVEAVASLDPEQVVRIDLLLTKMEGLFGGGQ